MSNKTVAAKAAAAQIVAALLTATALASAQTGPPRFEVVSIKPSAPGTFFSASPSPGGKFTARGIPAGLLLQMAFGVQGADLVGVPDWAKNDLFDVEAVPARSLSHDEIAPAMRAMLEDRFKLVTHFSSADVAGYNLVLAGRDSKLKIAAERTANEKWGFLDSEFKLTARDVSLTDLTQRLTGIVGKPVADKTDLHDRYDFSLEWDRRALSGSTPPSNPVVGLTIFSALEAQLGLKLESSKITHQFIVIDYIDRPSPN